MKFSIKSGMVAVSALVVATGMATFRAQADEWDKKTIMTVDQPTQIMDTYLEPGTYVLKLLNSDSNRHVVQIYNQDQNRLINMVMAVPNYRLQPTGNSRFLFWETPAGSAHALRAWFYPGDNSGQEFPYPKQLRQLAALTVVQARNVEPPPPPPAPEPTVKQREEPAPTVVEPEAPQAVSQESSKQEEVIIAQNNVPPPPEPVAQAPEPAPIETKPEELPKTATPYPIAGFAGLFSLSLYGLLRLRRPA